VPKSYQTTITLTPGATYKYKVEARNSVGFSVILDQVTLLTAQIPDQVSAASTTRFEDEIFVSWTAPYSGSSEITSYTITFLESDGLTYSQELTYCDGTVSEIMDSTECTIPSTVFTQTPYNLAWGSSIFAQVVATNIKGTSTVSVTGNGALILRIPDAPLNLENVASLTDFDTVGLTWDEGVENGGTKVIDYRVWYSQDATTFSILESSIVILPYQVNSLTVGVTYTFKVESRNAYGYSAQSSEISVLTA
jgi:hypothetical protein